MNNAPFFYRKHSYLYSGLEPHSRHSPYAFSRIVVLVNSLVELVAINHSRRLRLPRLALEERVSNEQTFLLFIFASATEPPEATLQERAVDPRLRIGNTLKRCPFVIQLAAI